MTRRIKIKGVYAISALKYLKVKNHFDLCKAVDVLPERVGGEEVHDQLVSGVGQGHE